MKRFKTILKFTICTLIIRILCRVSIYRLYDHTPCHVARSILAVNDVTRKAHPVTSVPENGRVRLGLSYTRLTLHRVNSSPTNCDPRLYASTGIWVTAGWTSIHHKCHLTLNVRLRANGCYVLSYANETLIVSMLTCQPYGSYNCCNVSAASLGCCFKYTLLRLRQ